jgi:hypothetical protein
MHNFGNVYKLKEMSLQEAHLAGEDIYPPAFLLGESVMPQQCSQTLQNIPTGI